MEINKIITGCKTEKRASRFSSVDEISSLLNKKHRSIYYIPACLGIIIIVGATLFGYQLGFQNALTKTDIPKSINTYDKIAAHSKTG